MTDSQELAQEERPGNMRRLYRQEAQGVVVPSVDRGRGRTWGRLSSNRPATLCLPREKRVDHKRPCRERGSRET